MSKKFVPRGGDARLELATAIHDYIELFHNARPRHSDEHCGCEERLRSAFDVRGEIVQQGRQSRRVICSVDPVGHIPAPPDEFDEPVRRPTSESHGGLPARGRRVRVGQDQSARIAGPAVVGALAFPAGAAACSCVAVDVRTQLETADAAVGGTVTRVGLPTPRPDGTMSSADPITVTIRVAHSYKRTIGRTLRVRTALSGASCGRAPPVRRRPMSTTRRREPDVIGLAPSMARSPTSILR